MTAPGCTHPSRTGRTMVDAHFRGDIRAAEERAMRGHLAECAACRDYYERHLVFAALDPRAKRAEERIGSALGLGRSKASRLRAPIAWSACAAGLALLFAMPWGRRAFERGERTEDEMTARGASSLAAESRVFVYRMDPHERLDGPSAAIGKRDALAFAYTNAPGYEHVLIFGVDEHRHVYWYYPAWTDPAQNPRAIAALGGREMRELPQAVRHDLDGAELVLHAVFTHDALSVRDVEALVANQDPESPVRIEGAFEQRIPLRVGP